ncbi:MAG TPA: hypothetical protein VFI06_06270 [Chitinophagaceae bacterium]|nr:hypothetical protein [Chitinophagaceae bacterium]
MKLIFPLAAIFALSLPAQKCNEKKKQDQDAIYRGKLEIKALCMNYTIRLIEGNLDTSQVVANWTDETTGKSYTNAFGLANPCDFPESLGQGDEFYFTLDTVKDRNCAVCMAYYPTPRKKLIIKVVAR